MSIPQVKFGDGGPYIQGVEDVLSPAIIYFPPASDHHTNRESGRPISILVNASSSSDPMTELELMELTNGCKILLIYRLFTTEYTLGITYHFSWEMRLVDKNGGIIRQSSGGRNINKSSLDPHDPFLEAYMNGGRVTFSTNRPSVAGEEATQYYPFCSIYTMKPSQIAPVPFVGDDITTVFENTWIHECYFAPIGGESAYDDLIDDLVEGGDGSDPVSPTPPTPTPGPAGSGDTSEPGGGDGNYDDDSDPIDFPDLPTGGALDSGAIVAHEVDSAKIRQLMGKLWSSNLINQFLHSIQDPMDAIVSLHALPVSPETTLPTRIFIGNYDVEIGAPTVSSQYVEVDCGSITTHEFWGSALDYSPYTSLEIFLPFIGIKELKIEDTMKTTIHVKYYVDVLTGDCVAFIKCGMSVLYHYTGNCKMSIPLSSRSSDALLNIAKGAVGIMSGIGVAMGPGAGAGLIGAGMAISSASSVAATKKTISRSGDITSNAGLMDDFIPYLIIHRPAQSLAKDYNKFKGYTSNITSKLSGVVGYTEVEHINLSIPGATDTELTEIKSLLQSGVII